MVTAHTGIGSATAAAANREGKNRFIRSLCAVVCTTLTGRAGQLTQEEQGEGSGGGRRKRCDGRKDGGRAGVGVMAARAAVEFGWILEGLQVVGHRYLGEKNHDEHGKRGDLRPPAGGLAVPMAEPEA